MKNLLETLRKLATTSGASAEEYILVGTMFLAFL